MRLLGRCWIGQFKLNLAEYALGNVFETVQVETESSAVVKKLAFHVDNLEGPAARSWRRTEPNAGATQFGRLPPGSPMRTGIERQSD
jgi:hypothetical protein